MSSHYKTCDGGTVWPRNIFTGSVFRCT